MKKAASYSLSRKLLLMLLFVISCSTHAMAQTDYFYDSYRTKTLLTLNESEIVVSIPKEYDKVSERIRSNVEVLYTKYDGLFDIINISRSDYEKLTSLEFWEEDAKYVIITPSYYIENSELGKVYGAAYFTPYVCIRLKKEEDTDLLASYLERYKLRISWHGSAFRVLYILALTLDSEKSPLEIANEMFESGDFANSTPDFAFKGSGAYETVFVRSITSATTEKSSEIYDLQGRRMAEGKLLQPGIYVKDGRKFVVK